MIVVRIELWPKGDAEDKRELALVVISNVGGDHELADYVVAVSHQFGSAYDKGERDPHKLLTDRYVAWRRGRVQGFRRSLGAVRLLHRALLAVMR